MGQAAPGALILLLATALLGDLVGLQHALGQVVLAAPQDRWCVDALDGLAKLAWAKGHARRVGTHASAADRARPGSGRRASTPGRGLLGAAPTWEGYKHLHGRGVSTVLVEEEPRLGVHGRRGRGIST